MTTTVSKVVPFLWYAKDAEEAVRFYASLIPNSSVDNVWAMAGRKPERPARFGESRRVHARRRRVQRHAGRADGQFNHAVSFVINCDDQAEVDRLWDALGEGGSYEACGWLKDKYGVSWQIVPTEFIEMMKDKDKARAGRVAKAMLDMVKLEVEPLRKAYEGTKAA